MGLVAVGLMLGGHWLMSRPKAAPVTGPPHQPDRHDSPSHPKPPSALPAPPADQPSEMPFRPERFTLDSLIHDGLKLAPLEPRRVAAGEELTVAFPLTELPTTGEPVYKPMKLPPGARFDQHAGVLTWTPDESDGPGTHTVTVHVCVPGRPELTDEISLTIHVVESRHPRS
jgi:hypothetical protein